MNAPASQHPSPRLTAAQRRALHLACAGIRVDDVPKRVKPVTLDSLTERGLIHQRTSRKGRTTWRATDIGRGIVAAGGLIPTFLHRMSQYGYTHDLALALWREPEVIL